jgi:hypothetical protein
MMLRVGLDDVQRTIQGYKDEGGLLNGKQPISIIHRTFRDGHTSSECLPTWLADCTMQGLADGNEPSVASACIVAVEFAV